MRFRMWLYPLVFLFLPFCVFSGCGGGGLSTSQSLPNASGSAQSTEAGDQGNGGISLVIRWPDGAQGGKLIPASADRIEVSVAGAGLSQPMVRSVPKTQAQNNQVELTFSGVPVGPKEIEVRAFDAGGQLVAHRIVPTAVQVGLTTQVSAPLGISLLDGLYKPGSFPLTRNEVVLWVNGGTMTHNITSDNGLFDSGPLNPGESFSWQATTPGNLPFHCNLHPGEIGALAVQFPSPAISNVNPGQGVAPPSAMVFGSSFTITGSNFGAARVASTVTIGGTNAGIVSWSDTQIVCTVPQGAVTGDVLVHAGGQATNPIYFPVAVPLATGQNYPVGIVAVGTEVFWIENPPSPPAGAVKKVSASGGAPANIKSLSSAGDNFNWGVAPGRGLAVNANANPDLVWLDYNSATNPYYQCWKVTLPGGAPTQFNNFGIAATRSSGWVAVNSTDMLLSYRFNGVNPCTLLMYPLAGGSLLYGRAGSETQPGSGLAIDGAYVLTATENLTGYHIFRGLTASPPFVNLVTGATTLAGTEIPVSSPANVAHIVADNTYVYWIETGASGKLRRANKTDGSGTVDLRTGLPNPRRLVVDKTSSDPMIAERLYWLDDQGLHMLSLATVVQLDLWMAPGVGSTGDLFFLPGSPSVIYWTEKASTGRVFRMDQ
ncbi:MAG: IPT/TIG domain-containing protein [Armatimonadetes bacterium]|nr:IPT/TIG domain-containing protein [Armatimonadota bacterium]